MSEDKVAELSESTEVEAENEKTTKRGRPAKTEQLTEETKTDQLTESQDEMVGIFAVKKYTIMDGAAPTVIQEGYQVVPESIAKHPYHAMVGTKLLGKIDPTAIDGAETKSRIDSWLITLGSIETGIFDAMGSLLNSTDAQKKDLADAAELVKQAQAKINSVLG